VQAACIKAHLGRMKPTAMSPAAQPGVLASAQAAQPGVLAGAQDGGERAGRAVHLGNIAGRTVVSLLTGACATW
jgi:hypothetical protein